MNTLDWIIIVAFFASYLVIGFAVGKRAGKNSSEFFLSGRTMSWWLLGVSMVATTTSTNSANLFTEIIRQKGISGNWVWWAFLLTGMLTVFVYAKLWHRTGVSTDIEFYELRYSGKAAAFLRGFRAVYLGVLFNTIITAWVILAAIKIGVVMLDWSPLAILVVIAVITGIYSMVGGFLGVLITDFVQFILIMIGAVVAAWYALSLPQVNGLANLVSHPAIVGKLSFFPDFSNTDLLLSVLIIPIAVQWWSVWYPGSEPGGGGYIAQRMLAAKDERNAVGGTLFFNIINYGLRPWPWFIVGLASILVFPDLESLKTAFPRVNPAIIGHDLAYPAMLTFLPHGLSGLVVASLIAALLSTVAAHLNWGSSYVVNDVYRRFIRPDASEKQLVTAGRVSTLVLMVMACALAPFLESAKRAFDLILQIGAGTGLLFILRWFWWRINACSEIVAMVASFLIACYFEFVHVQVGLAPLAQWQRLVIGVVVTAGCWLAAAYLTKPTDDATLFRFCRLVRAGGPGWATIFRRAEAARAPIAPQEQQWDVPRGVLCMVLGCSGVYCTLFATGSWIYGYYGRAAALTAGAVVATSLLWVLWNRMYGASGARGRAEPGPAATANHG